MVVQLGALIAAGAVFTWSGISPRDRFTWWLEVFPALIGFAVLMATGRRFPLTRLVYVLIALHMIILFIGGHYTYAEVPLFNWLRDELHLARNHYDRFGHLAQGFVPAIIAREIFIRRRVVNSSGWRAAIIIFVCLGISALYELVEWITAISTGSAAEAFIGNQGDPWDTQEDMCCALVGAIAALLLLSKWHDREIARIQASRLLSAQRATAILPFERRKRGDYSG